MKAGSGRGFAAGALAGAILAATYGAAAGNALASASWKFKNYENKLTFETNSVDGCDGFFVVHGSSNKCDTAWSAETGSITIPADAREFLLSVEVKSPNLILDQGRCGDGWNNAIKWFGANGKKISA